MIRNKIRRFLDDSSGAAALEFALIAVPLLTFTFGIIEIGRALFMQQQLSFAADAAARELYIAPDTDPATLSAQIVDDLFLADPARLTVLIGSATGSSGTTAFDTVQLSISYDFQSVVPGFVTDQIPLSFERNVTVEN
jgi:Flp pilus assembly protein TadG